MGVTWKFEGSDFTESQIGEFYGFVYLITNLQTDKKYIGKKFFYSARTKVLKGKKKRYKIASDWQTYYGSNTELQNDVKTLGEQMFLREILYLCKTKGECGYVEAKEQFNRTVLETDDFYNTWIMVRVRKSHIKEYNGRVRSIKK
jgi:hypothetical protein